MFGGKSPVHPDTWYGFWHFTPRKMWKTCRFPPGWNVENSVETVKNPPFYRPFSGGKFRPFSPRFSTAHPSIRTEKGGFCHPAAFSEYLFTARRRCGNPGWRGRGSPARSSRGSCPSRRSARRCGSQTSCRSGRRPPRRFPDACQAARGPAP